MPMKVEAAIVTQKRPEAVYNTDSVNVNGKVMPREVIKNGYKGSGVLSDSAYFVLTSSDVEGFADASVMAFNERAELFARSREPMSVFSGFFEDCRGALLNMERSENDLVCAGFYARGRKAVIARNGATKVYLQRLGVTTPVTTEKVTDTTADFSGAVFSDVCQGDIFILLSPGAAEALGDKEIEDILRISDGSVKRVVNYILKVALAADGDKAVSAVVVKVLETAVEEEITAPAFVPDFGEEKKNGEAVEETAADVADVHAEATEEAEHYADEADSSEETDETSAEDESCAEEENPAQASFDETDDISAVFAKNALEMFENSEVLDEASDKNDEVLYTEEIEAAPEFGEAETEEATPAEKKDGKKSRTPLFVILGIMLAVSLALIIAFFVVPAFSGNGEETTAEETTTEEESTDEETTDEETTDEESSEEETTEEKTTAQESTTRNAPTENTTSAPVTEATTAAPVVVPEQTTAEQEETEATTEAEEATTAAEEITTAAPEEEPAETTTEALATDAPAEASEEASAEPEAVQ